MLGQIRVCFLSKNWICGFLSLYDYIECKALTKGQEYPAIAHKATKAKDSGPTHTLIPGAAAFSTRKVTRMKPLMLSPPGKETMGSKLLWEEKKAMGHAR